MRAMRVLRLVTHALTREPVLLLGEVDGDRCVPVFLRRPHADVIALGPRGAADPPLPQDVVPTIVGGLGRALEAAEITALRAGAFEAVLVLDGGTRIPVRPSEALAVAVREGLPIAVADAVVDEVGQPTAELLPAGAEAPPGEQLRDFRRFIEGVSPDDFRA